MLNKIISFSIKNKLIIGLFVLGLIGYGAYQVTQLPIDAVPDITNNQVQVITVSPSLGGQDVERLITFPIEQATTNIPGLKKIRSFSRFGLSLVTIVFEDDVDVYWARQQVAERLQKVKDVIPPGVGTPEMAPVTTGLGEIYQYVVRTKPGYEDKYSLMELRTIQDWIVRRDLLGIKGVADVSTFGGKLKQYQVAVIPSKLKAYNITISDVYKALEKNNQNTGGAYINKGPTVLFIRSEGLLESLDEIRNIVVKNLPDGTPVLIDDIGKVELGAATRYGAVCYNDQGEVPGAVVMMLKGANSSKVITAVKDRVKEIQKALPEGVVIEPFLDRTKMVDNAINTVEHNLAEGALIVIFVLILFLGNIRAGLIVASVIPMSMLFAVIMMNLFGVSGNLMSLGAIDFGLIVDGAVIIVEAVLHRLTHSKHYAHMVKLNQDQMDEEVKFSASKMMNSAVFGQVIILIVYLPILTLQGIEGKMFRPMAQTVSFALIGASILSLTYVPMISSLLLSKKTEHKRTLSDRFMFWLERIYQHALERVLKYPKLVIAFAFALLTLATVTLSRMGGEFIPTLEEGDFAVDTRVLTGSNLETTIEKTQQTAHILLTQFPEVEKVVTKIGSGEIPTDPMPINASDMMVILKDKDQWTSAKTFDELAEKMNKALRAVPGVTTGFQYPVQMRFNELMTGAKQDVVCKIFGEDLDTLAKYSQRLGKIINTVDGTADLYTETVTGMPQIVVRYDRAAIAQYGLNIEDVNTTLNAAFAGQVAGQVYNKERRFDLVVKLDQKERKNLSQVQNLLIPTPAGTQIPLNKVAQVKIEEGPVQIQREDAKRRIIIGFNVRGRDVESIVNDLKAKVNQQLKLPAGYLVTYGGDFQNLQEARQRLAIAVPIALLMIFFMLYFAFGSVKQSVLIFTAIPLSAIGGIMALATRGMPFSISAGVGFIALFGVAVLNGIVLIAEFNSLREEGWKDLRRVVLQGTKIRLRPVLMTASVASMGFFPMALSQGAGAEVQRPLATVVIGGLATATFLTLFVLPVLYILFDRFSFSKLGKKTKLILLLASSTLLLPAVGHAQEQGISYQAAVDSALQHNLSLQVDEWQIEAQRKMEKAGFDLPKTQLGAQYGQFNSERNDWDFSISQTLSLPTVYTRQKKMYAQETALSQQAKNWHSRMLKQEVGQTYYAILWLRAKERLLQDMDSLFADFLRKAELKFEQGDNNVLEKSTAITQRMQIKAQLKQIQADKARQIEQFQQLVHAQTRVVPEASAMLKRAPLLLLDSGRLSTHPYAEYLKQQVKVSTASWKVEKSRLLPDISLGVYQQTFKGLAAYDNPTQIYGGNDWFRYAHVGVHIPLFFGAQKAKATAARVETLKAETQKEKGYEQLNTEYKQALSQYQQYLETVDSYESGALKSVDQMMEAANLKLKSGDISYLEWVLLMQQALSVRMNYLNVVHDYNQSNLWLQNLLNL